MGHIFISYSHSDTKYAHALADHLQNMGFEVWIDERLRYGSQWAHEIETRLDSCDAFILVMTPRSFASRWVQNELQRAQRKGKPIFPLLLEGEPSLSVESIQYYDVRDGDLPGAKFYAELKHLVSKKPVPVTPTHPPTLPPNGRSGKTEPNPKRGLALTGLSAIAFVAFCATSFLAIRLVGPIMFPDPTPTTSALTTLTGSPLAATSPPNPTQSFTPFVEVTVQPPETQPLPSATHNPPTATSTSTRTPTDTAVPPTPVPNLVLYSWYSPSRGDNFANTFWVGSPVTKSPDYSFSRIEGYVYSPDEPHPPGTVPLYSYYSNERGDNVTTTSQTDEPGYELIRIEGYIYSPDAPRPPGTVPLYKWWSDSREDNYTTTTPVWSVDLHLTKSPDYRFPQLEGYIRQP